MPLFSKKIQETIILDFYWENFNFKPMVTIAKAKIYPYQVDKFDNFGKGQKTYNFTDNDIIFTTEEIYGTLFGTQGNHIKHDNDFTGETYESWIIPVSSIDQAMQIAIQKIFKLEIYRK